MIDTCHDPGDDHVVLVVVYYPCFLLDWLAMVDIALVGAGVVLGRTVPTCDRVCVEVGERRYLGGTSPNACSMPWPNVLWTYSVLGTISSYPLLTISSPRFHEPDYGVLMLNIQYVRYTTSTRWG